MLNVDCQLCGKRPATTHLTELDPDNGQRQELHLCVACIQKLELKLESGPPPIAAILGMKPEDLVDTKTNVVVTASDDDERCPECGLAFAEFGSGKLFGCAHDYTAFSDKVELLLRHYHGSARHVGRGPSHHRSSAEAELLGRRTQLDAALREAVSSENYENAAKLRDEIRRLDQTHG